MSRPQPYIRSVPSPRPPPPAVYLESPKPDVVRDLVFFLVGVITGIALMVVVWRFWS